MSPEAPKQIELSLAETALVGCGFVKDTVKSGDQYHPYDTIYANDKLKLTVFLSRDPRSNLSGQDGITGVMISIVLPPKHEKYATPQQLKALKPFLEALYPEIVAHLIHQRLGFIPTPQELNQFDIKRGTKAVFGKTDEFAGYKWRLNKEIGAKDFTSTHLHIHPQA